MIKMRKDHKNEIIIFSIIVLIGLFIAVSTLFNKTAYGVAYFNIYKNTSVKVSGLLMEPSGPYFTNIQVINATLMLPNGVSKSLSPNSTIQLLSSYCHLPLSPGYVSFFNGTQHYYLLCGDD